MRDRQWRKWKEETKVKKRLKNALNFTFSAYWSIEDASGQRILNPSWYDWLGTKTAHLLKNGHTKTDKKTKWRSQISTFIYLKHKTRLKDKSKTKKIYDELGFKHLPARIYTRLED